MHYIYSFNLFCSVLVFTTTTTFFLLLSSLLFLSTPKAAVNDDNDDDNDNDDANVDNVRMRGGSRTGNTFSYITLHIIAIIVLQQTRYIKLVVVVVALIESNNYVHSTR